MKRYLFSLIFLILALLGLTGWWQSTRNWTSWDLETPVGIFKAQSMSSLFIAEAKIMNHEHRWAAFSHADEVTGELMEFPAQWPQLRSNSAEGMIFMIPYWELVLIFCLLSAACLLQGWLRIWKHQKKVLASE